MDDALTLKEQFKKLPQDLQKTIIASGWRQSVQDISTKYNLNRDDEDVLETETMIILFGLETPDTFRENLSNNINLPQEKLEAVANDVNDMVFEKVADLILQVHGENVEEAPTAAEPNNNNGGVEIEETRAEEDENVSAEESTVARDDVLAKIEQPEHVEPTKTALDQKLGAWGPKKEPEKQTNNSNNPVQTKRYPDGHDPYREPIE